MMIGKRGAATTAISAARPDHVARTAGLIAHLGEEAEVPIGFLLAAKGEEAILHRSDESDAAR